MRRQVLDILLACAALLPFYSIYAAHCVNPDGASGFIQYDMPYYVANGRDIFERGNGFAGPNPYDENPNAPTIYFHWFTWILGFSVVVLGLDPGFVFVSLGLVAGISGSWLTLQIIRQLIPDNRAVTPVFLLSMWGGGLFVLFKCFLNLAQGEPLLSDVLMFDLGRGWWFMSWGRNFILPTEAVYHAFAAGIWLCVLRRREWSAVTLVLVLAATHPFTGIQQLLILGAWNLAQLIVNLYSGRPSSSEQPNEMSTPKVDLSPLWRGLVLTAGLAAFLGYYFIFLEQFASHRNLRSTWALEWVVPPIVVALAYGVVMLLAFQRMHGNWRNFVPETWFFLVAFAVSFLLIQHDYFVKPHQPLHFARGYVWLPLFLIAAPRISSWVISVRDQSSRARQTLILALVILLASLDNIAFLTITTRENSNNIPLSHDARDAFRWMDEQQLEGVLLIPDDILSYLSATFTSAQPYHGHKFNTPDYPTRKENVDAWKADGTQGDWMETIDYVLLPAENNSLQQNVDHWKRLYENNGFILFERSPLKSSQKN
ncbi:hypothetical protein [Thalassoglobus sp.]|uniref:hypothetical protein n=1 Tax=Thalassoglobus sp. TaxID=2795869 RepID=UPI003AA91552